MAESVLSQSRKRLLIFIVAYHAESTIAKVLARIPNELASEYDVEILIIDDGSLDRTFNESAAVSRNNSIPFKITVLCNPINQGYGGNQKIGYHYAIKFGFDYVALLHGDGQYAPEVLPELVRPLVEGKADAVFGSRMLTSGAALKGGMPFYKFVGNKILTKLQNAILGMNLSEFHSGYRVYSVDALKAIPIDRNSNVFHFDTEIIIQLNVAGKRIAEVPIPTYYGGEICRVDGIKYAKDVLRASVQARLQKANVFYDRRFDCAIEDAGTRYPSKLQFDSTHSNVVNMVPSGAKVLELGSGIGAVGAALKQKGCYVVGCDLEKGPYTQSFDRFEMADLDAGIPDFGGESFDYILCLDVIEHLNKPEEFLDQLRAVAAEMGAQVILTTANIGFIAMRISLLLGRFEYGKRGILDLTHKRLFTFATMRRAMESAALNIVESRGVVLPLPLIFGDSTASRMLMKFNRALCRFWPSLFGFQILLRAQARTGLETLLRAAEHTAAQRLSTGATQIDGRAA